MREKLEALKERALRELEELDSLQKLKDFQVRYLGRKGELKALLRGMGKLPPEERPLMGQLANRIKDLMEKAITDREEVLRAEEERRRLESERIDVTLPGRVPEFGGVHPLTRVLREIEEVFISMGFQVAQGPEIEMDYYNFEALNIPPHHPARDMQDTFYIEGGLLLRTHTSPVQIRVMERFRPPIRIIAPGKVYRRDADVSHTPMFHQVEGLLVDEVTTFADLKGVLEEFALCLFGPQTKVRFRPSYFPFTEPSAEMDIGCVMCGGEGCRVCKGSGWLEILGCGMVDPAVYSFVDYDPQVYRGFAFGLGVERIAMLKYRIDDIRLFFENDLRFLRQFL
ncbi:MAG: phenylalanine--tRNA ligase subunit alpha [Aquificota bacterium]|nr:MAG: phenylalanine--tRNA ligase subunit alpha [Aquificota bacterium]